MTTKQKKLKNLQGAAANYLEASNIYEEIYAEYGNQFGSGSRREMNRCYARYLDCLLTIIDIEYDLA